MWSRVGNAPRQVADSGLYLYFAINQGGVLGWYGPNRWCWGIRMGHFLKPT